MKLSEWEDEIQALSNDQLNKLDLAFRTLNEWPVLRKEFCTTGLFSVGYMIKISAKEVQQ